MEYEPPIVTTMPHKGLHFSSILWSCNIQNDFNLLFIRANAIFGHNMAQNLSLSYHEDTLFRIQAESIQLTLLKYRSKLSQVIHPLSRMNTQIININVQKASEEFLEDMTHESLKG